MNKLAKRVSFFLLFFGLFGALKALYEAQPVAEAGVISFIVIGATGDLAKRKIWPSIVEMISKNQISTTNVHFYAGARESPDMIHKTLDSYFNELDCPKQTEEMCTNLKIRIMNIITCVKLKNAQDYSNLNKEMLQKNKNEAIRIFYLAVPPFAYSDIADNVNKHCRPINGELRIAIEKPFGRDLSSAEELAMELRKFLTDNEVYLVDHYLHKEGVKQIREFLTQNSKIFKHVWNHKNIKYVEIVAKEKLDARSRTGYYDHYGVIRDMLQSHLTELLAIIATAIDGEGDTNEFKHAVLKKVTNPFIGSCFVGQYKDYQQHLMEDTGNRNLSRTLTFASVLLYIQDKNWFDVPFFLTSGKSLSRREGFVRVVFKDGTFNECSNPEILFTFNTDKAMEGPSVTLSNHIPNIAMKSFTGTPGERGSCESQVIYPDNSLYSNAYVSVIMGLIDGEKGLFVPLENIIQSWHIWTPLLTELETDEVSNDHLHIYYPQTIDHMILDATGTQLVTTNPNTLQFTDISPSHMTMMASTGTASITTDYIRNHPVYMASRSTLLKRLAADLYQTARTSVAAKGAFHLALPGGSSHLELFQILSLDYRDTFPWSSTHMWQTDERCVPVASSDSNIRQLQASLFDFIDIPSSNIHQILSGKCIVVTQT